MLANVFGLRPETTTILGSGPLSPGTCIGLCAGSGDLQVKREEQLVSGAEGAARDETDRIESSVTSRMSMWRQDAPGGCDFRADMAVWDDIGRPSGREALGSELESDMILV